VSRLRVSVSGSGTYGHHICAQVNGRFLQPLACTAVPVTGPGERPLRRKNEVRVTTQRVAEEPREELRRRGVDCWVLTRQWEDPLDTAGQPILQMCFFFLFVSSFFRGEKSGTSAHHLSLTAERCRRQRRAKQRSSPRPTIARLFPRFSHGALVLSSSGFSRRASRRALL
jgi:hypothetical protein